MVDIRELQLRARRLNPRGKIMNAVIVLRIVLRVVKSIASRRPDSEVAQIIVDAIEVILSALGEHHAVTASGPSELSDDDVREINSAVDEIKSVS